MCTCRQSDDFSTPFAVLVYVAALFGGMALLITLVGVLTLWTTLPGTEKTLLADVRGVMLAAFLCLAMAALVFGLLPCIYVRQCRDGWQRCTHGTATLLRYLCCCYCCPGGGLTMAEEDADEAVREDNERLLADAVDVATGE